MTTTAVRVRFAPSPTGFMHLGNVRAALINYLYAKQKNGIFILRIEDTDAQRNIDALGLNIIEDLKWLKLPYDQGPIIGGPNEPYYQSERGTIYKTYLDKLIAKKAVYRCFCTVEELDRKRKRQLALKLPPRYDKACLKLTPEQIEANLTNKVPFIWRFELSENQSVTFYDLAHKEMHFELKHFSDIPLTRQDGSFTFMFANFVDDVEMKITQVVRGEDHLTNTACQIPLYQAFNAQIPIFYHLPIICNKEGKKLSKRDFGFSLTDLRNAGFLPEAIVNYLAIIGASFEQEIMDLNTLAGAINFDHLSPTGQIKYDIEKLRWINHQWIKQYDTEKLTQLCYPSLSAAFNAVTHLPAQDLLKLMKLIQPELITLTDSIITLRFYFIQPDYDHDMLQQYNRDTYKDLLNTTAEKILTSSAHDVIDSIKKAAKERNIPLKDIMSLVRIALTGTPQGLSIAELINILGAQESHKRLTKMINW